MPLESLAELTGRDLLLYEANPLRLESCLLCLMHRYQQRESRKMKKQATMFQRTQDKSLERDHSELEIYHLLGIQNNHHKCVHLSEENNA